MTYAVLGFRSPAQEWAGGRNPLRVGASRPGRDPGVACGRHTGLRERIFRRSAPDEGFGPDAVETGGESRFRKRSRPPGLFPGRSGSGVFGPPERFRPSDSPERAARLTRGCSRNGRRAVISAGRRRDGRYAEIHQALNGYGGSDKPVRRRSVPMVTRAEERTTLSVAEIGERLAPLLAGRGVCE